MTFQSRVSIVIKRFRSLITKTRSRGLGWLAGRLRVESAAPTALIREHSRRLLVRARGALHSFAGTKEINAKNDVLYVFLDFEVCPVTFDVVSYLAAAEIYRRENGYSSLHCVIVPGTVGGLREEIVDYDIAVGLEKRRWRLHHIVIPLFRLLPHCSGYTVCATRFDAKVILSNLTENYFPKGYSVNFPVVPRTSDICDAARSRRNIFPMYRTTPTAQAYVQQFIEPRAKGRHVIVLSLRKYAYMPSRDSNIDAWMAFARQLDPTKWLAIFVLDTDAALAPRPPELDAFIVFEPASWDLELRMALYERADLNMAIAQGPMQLCWLNDHCRYAMFVKPGSSPQSSEQALMAYGFRMGESPPYAVAGQRWVWTADDLPMLVSVFEEMTAV